jgi:hypothetical protein
VIGCILRKEDLCNRDRSSGVREGVMSDGRVMSTFACVWKALLLLLSAALSRAARIWLGARRGGASGNGEAPYRGAAAEGAFFDLDASDDETRADANSAQDAR